MEPRRRFRSVILFTADWHIKLGQKNVPISWACTRYKMFFEQLENIVMDNNVSLHIVGGDLFDRVPSMDELTLYFDFVKNVKCWTIIFDGNHEATRKNKTFFFLKKKRRKDFGKAPSSKNVLGMRVRNFLFLKFFVAGEV